MQIKMICLFFFILMSHSNLGAAIKNEDEDVFFQVSSKLSQIQSQLSGQRIFVTNATVSWNEMDHFQKDLMFVVAHDPNGPKSESIPTELLPASLTTKLKDSWKKLEVSAIQMGDLEKSLEWGEFKILVEQFIKLREEFFYQPARIMIKDGSLNEKLLKVKALGLSLQKVDSSKKNISIRVLDPVIEGLTGELEKLNQSVTRLKELREPPKTEPQSVFKKEHIQELTLFGVGIGFATICLTFIGLWIGKMKTKKASKVEQVSTPAEDAFDYGEWLVTFEASLKSFKNVEDRIVEDHLILKQQSYEMHEARKKLNVSDNQIDFYQSLDQLNLTAPKIEDYFEKINLKKNTEASRKMVNNIVQLCQAIESGQYIQVTETKKFKLIKNTTNGYGRVA